jgi:hypothetical protein
MLEIERYISNGKWSAFFRIREHPNLGVKICYMNVGNKARKYLQEELNKAIILKKFGVSVLDYREVVQVRIPEHIEQTFKKSTKEMASGIGKDYYDDMKNFFINFKGKLLWGLVMEYLPDDVICLQFKNKSTLVSKNRIEYLYSKEVEKLDELGVGTGDSSFDSNVLWSESRAKLYFIDFEDWDLEYIGNEEYIQVLKNNRKLKKSGLYPLWD